MWSSLKQLWLLAYTKRKEFCRLELCYSLGAMVEASCLLLFHKCRLLTEAGSLTVTTIPKPCFGSQCLDKYIEGFFGFPWSCRGSSSEQTYVKRHVCPVRGFPDTSLQSPSAVIVAFLWIKGSPLFSKDSNCSQVVFGKLSISQRGLWISFQAGTEKVGCKPYGGWVFAMDISVPVYLFGGPHQAGSLACVGE